MNHDECRAMCTSPQIPLREKLLFWMIDETTTRPREALEARIELSNVIPVGKIGNEIEQCAAKLHRVVKIPAIRTQRVKELLHESCCIISEPLRTVGVRRIGPESCIYHGAACCLRAARPPDVKRGDMAVPDAFLAAVVLADFLYGQVDFDEALGVMYHVY